MSVVEQDSPRRDVVVPRSRVAFAYMDRDEAGSRRERYEKQMRAFANGRGWQLNRTIVDFDGRGAEQLVDLLHRYQGGVVLIPTRGHLQFVRFRELASHADTVVEVART